MTAPVLVTGATGNVGGAVARALTAMGVPVRVAGSDPTVLRRRFPQADPVRLDFLDPGTFPAALAGAGALFLLRPPPIARVGPTINALLDAAARTDVRHVVFSSVTGADTNRLVPHHRIERHLLTVGLPWTILRPGFFAQNLADAYRTDIRADDRIYLPAGHGRAAFVDTRDVGHAAAIILREPERHRGKAYPLTGPQALDFPTVASLLSREVGRHIRYQPATVTGYARHLHRRGMPATQILVQTVLHTGLRRGQAQTVDPTLPQLLGRAPTTLAQYVHDHRDTWMRG